MYRGKYSAKKKHTSKKPGILIASIMLIVLLTVGMTVAFLIDDTGALVNEFDPAHVSCEVKETFDGTTKENVYIKNTSDIDAYIRATYVINWTKYDEDTGTYKIVPPPAGYGYTGPNINETDWELQSDGYYLYKEKVAKDGNTANLINSITAEYPDGNTKYFLQVDIIAEAIQAEPDTVIQTNWGYSAPEA